MTTHESVAVPANTSAPVRTFVRHYVEMVIAMIVGMVVLGGAVAALLSVAGVDLDGWQTSGLELTLLGMAFVMSAPMVAWMRYRGHGWRPAAEMTAAMFGPSLLAIALLWAGLVEDPDTLLMIQHVLMLPSMLAVMLIRPGEYTGHRHG